MEVQAWLTELCYCAAYLEADARRNLFLIIISLTFSRAMVEVVVSVILIMEEQWALSFVQSQPG